MKALRRKLERLERRCNQPDYCACPFDRERVTGILAGLESATVCSRCGKPYAIGIVFEGLPQGMNAAWTLEGA